MKALTISIIIILTIPVFSQESNKESERVRRNIVQFRPGSLFSIFNPTLFVGYERVVSKNLSIRIDYGIILKRSIGGYIIHVLPTKSGHPPNYDTFSGQVFGLEFKRWLNYDLTKPPTKLFNKFISIKGFYLRNITESWGNFSVVDDSFEYPEYIEGPRPLSVYRESFKIDKTRIGANIKFGYQFRFKHWVVTGSAGIGVLNRKAIHFDRINLNDKMKTTWPKYNRKGNEILLNIPIDVSIGYRF